MRRGPLAGVHCQVALIVVAPPLVRGPVLLGSATVRRLRCDACTWCGIWYPRPVFFDFGLAVRNSLSRKRVQSAPCRECRRWQPTQHAEQLRQSWALACFPDPASRLCGLCSKAPALRKACRLCRAAYEPPFDFKQPHSSCLCMRCHGLGAGCGGQHSARSSPAAERAGGGKPACRARPAWRLCLAGGWPPQRDDLPPGVQQERQQPQVQRPASCRLWLC